MGAHIPHRKGQFWGKRSPIVKYRDFLQWAVQKQLNRWRCHLGYGLSQLGGPNEACIRWGQIPHVKGQLLGERTCPMTFCHELCQNGWTSQFAIWVVECVPGWDKGSASSVAFTRWRQWEGTLAPPGEYDLTFHLWRRCGPCVKLLWPLVSLLILSF